MELGNEKTAAPVWNDVPPNSELVAEEFFLTRGNGDVFRQLKQLFREFACRAIKIRVNKMPHRSGGRKCRAKALVMKGEKELPRKHGKVRLLKGFVELDERKIGKGYALRPCYIPLGKDLPDLSG